MVFTCSICVGRACPQCWHCSGSTGWISPTLSRGARGRCAPRWPGCPPAFRRLFFRRPRWRGSPASPSEEGGLEEFVEFCLRNASCRSKSAICFSASAICCCCLAISSAWRRICRSFSTNSRRSRSISHSEPLGCWPRCRALIHHTVADPARFVQQNRLGYLNCYVLGDPRGISSHPHRVRGLGRRRDGPGADVFLPDYVLAFS